MKRLIFCQISFYLQNRSKTHIFLNFEDNNVFFNIENLESLCKDCHNKEHFKDNEEEEYIFDENGDVIKND